MYPFDPAVVTAVLGIISGVVLVVATYAFFSPVELNESSRGTAPGLPRRATRRQAPVEQPVVVLAERRRP